MNLINSHVDVIPDLELLQTILDLKNNKDVNLKEGC